MADRFFDRHFVKWSSPESIEVGKISLLAVAEVTFSVAAYWWFAWYFNTYAHLLISVIIAPLVLLRSDESVELGVKMLVKYMDPLEDEHLSFHSLERVFFVIFTGSVVGIATWLAANWLLAEHEGWTVFWRSAPIGAFALNIAVAVGIALTGTATGRILAEVLVALLGAAAIAGATAGPVALFGVGAGVAAVVVAFVLTILVPKKGERLMPILVPGAVVGILFRAIAIRLIASLRHIHKGFAAFPRNWRHTLFHIDFRCAPEIVPGIGKRDPGFNFRVIFEDYFIASDLIDKLAGAIVVPIIYVPSLLYRYSLKSTCWLYLPLIYVAHLPGRLQASEGRLVWVRALPSKFVEGIRFGLAVGTLGVAFLALIDASALRTLLTAVGAGETPITIFSLLVVLDFKDIHPWQYFTLPSAALTVVLFLWLDSIRKEESAGAAIDSLGWKIRTAVLADRFRSLLVHIWLALALYYFAEYSYGRCLLPEWLTFWLEWHFGSIHCPAPTT